MMLLIALGIFSARRINFSNHLYCRYDWKFSDPHILNVKKPISGCILSACLSVCTYVRTNIHGWLACLDTPAIKLSPTSVAVSKPREEKGAITKMLLLDSYYSRWSNSDLMCQKLGEAALAYKQITQNPSSFFFCDLVVLDSIYDRMMANRPINESKTSNHLKKNRTGNTERSWVMFSFVHTCREGFFSLLKIFQNSQIKKKKKKKKWRRRKKQQYMTTQHHYIR